mmetsp:Transcript_34736/g.83951  ORF Transcript_34736/g.83951 Transcript_34736/m.83951 type:complete len:498 (-) Transcript_34736:263-1756(-)
MFSRLARSSTHAVARRGFASQAFPSMRITSQAVTAQGSFAEAQVAFLDPDVDAVKRLDNMLAKKKLGVVMHYYMDPELQGLVAACDYEHVFCADSLAMTGAAVEMAKAGVRGIACLGVDFMSESVRSTLDQNGFSHVPVYTLSKQHIGCSLAEMAERPAYSAYLQKASQAKHPLHVVYINTSMHTKATAHDTVPTITCTSSNVVRTVLQAAAQVPDVSIWYGPDTYMGTNLKNMFERMVTLPDEQIAKLHPAHNQQTIRDLLARFDYFKQGMCVVHHMFGGQVVQTIKTDYPIDDNTYYTAHLEVPGEMFMLAMDAQQHGKGVVGSTSNILNFIKDKAKEAASEGKDCIRVLLGTEVGMVTAIVKETQDILKQLSDKTAVEIVFPVAAEAMTATGEEGDLSLLPGVQGGEGCSTAGGCAACPFMKMNDLDALMDLAEAFPESGNPVTPQLEAQLATIRQTDGLDLAGSGGMPIKYMRHLMQNGDLADDLVTSIRSKQ